MVGIKDFGMPSCCGKCNIRNDECDFCDITWGTIYDDMEKLKDCPLVEAIPKDQLKELRSMALRVKHNTGSIDTLIDKLDDLLSEVQE